MLACVAAFGVAVITFIVALTAHGAPRLWGAIGGLGFVLSSAASSFAALALAARFARSRVPMLDSLRDNAYGMYLIHYLFVSWLQYALLGAHLPGLAKGSLAFLGTLALSWGAIAALRRVPAVARVL